MSVELVTLLMFSSMLVLLATGLPIAFSLGSIAVIFAYFLWGPVALRLTVTSVLGPMNNFVFVAIPLFIFMGSVLERSGVAEDLYTLMHQLFASVRGGLAIGTVAICTIFAAMSGLSATATVTMGLIALPSMLKRRYGKGLAMGSIMAGGALGILIPPSVPFIIYSIYAAVSVGKLFLGGILPGLLLSLLFVIYIVIRCLIQPKLGPMIPPEERTRWKEKLISTRAIILPSLLVAAVLGSIFTGLASPTEASGLGAFGSIICAVIHRRFTWKVAKNAAYTTLRITAMVMWIIVAANCFSTVYGGIGAVEFITNAVKGFQISPWVILIGMQFILFIMGMFLDPNAIMMITLPIFLPIAEALGFDLVWFGVLFVMNMEMGYLTPPSALTYSL